MKTKKKMQGVTLKKEKAVFISASEVKKKEEAVKKKEKGEKEEMVRKGEEEKEEKEEKMEMASKEERDLFLSGFEGTEEVGERVDDEEVKSGHVLGQSGHLFLILALLLSIALLAIGFLVSEVALCEKLGTDICYRGWMQTQFLLNHVVQHKDKIQYMF